MKHKYTDEIYSLDKSCLKLSTTEFEELYACFSRSVGQKLKSDEYMKLFKYNKLPDFINQLNSIQKVYSGRNKSEFAQKKNSEKEVQISDCIQVDIDTHGNFKGFQIRSETTKLTWADDPKLTKRIIETVNFMNRLLFDKTEYKLVDKDSKIGEQPKANQGNVQPEDNDSKKLFEILQDHALDVIVREKP